MNQRLTSLSWHIWRISAHPAAFIDSVPRFAAAGPPASDSARMLQDAAGCCRTLQVSSQPQWNSHRRTYVAFGIPWSKLVKVGQMSDLCNHQATSCKPGFWKGPAACLHMHFLGSNFPAVDVCIVFGLLFRNLVKQSSTISLDRFPH